MLKSTTITLSNIIDIISEHSAKRYAVTIEAFDEESEENRKAERVYDSIEDLRSGLYEEIDHDTECEFSASMYNEDRMTIGITVKE